MPRHAVARRTSALLALAAALALGACSTSPAPDADPESATATTTETAQPSTATTPAAAFPLTLDNCGTPVTVQAAPERIVTVKSAMTQLVVALGAGDRIVGTAYQDSPLEITDPVMSGELATGTAAATTLLDAVPSLGERMPSREGVLSVEPHLVLAGWESVFAADAAGERAGYADLGIATFVAPAACSDAATAAHPLTWDDVFAEVTQIGAVLGLPQEAETLVSALEEDLDAVENERADALDGAEPTDGPTVLWWSSGSDTPYVGAGTGSPHLIMETAGLINVAQDLEGGWAPYSWESAAAANPDYLVLVDSAWNTAEHKKELLASNPVTATMTAVQQQRYLVVPFALTEAGVGNVAAVRLLLDQLAEQPPA